MQLLTDMKPAVMMLTSNSCSDYDHLHTAEIQRKVGQLLPKYFALHPQIVLNKIFYNTHLQND